VHLSVCVSLTAFLTAHFCSFSALNTCAFVVAQSNFELFYFFPLHARFALLLIFIVVQSQIAFIQQEHSAFLFCFLIELSVVTFKLIEHFVAILLSLYHIVKSSIL